MNETITTTFLGTTGTTVDYSGTYGGGFATPLNGPSATIISNGVTLSQAIANSNNMNKQVKVAVFTVERNEDNKVTSSKFVKEFWVENKNGSSIVLAAAKQLDKDYDPDTTIIREITSITF